MSESLSTTPKRERLISFDASAASTLLDTGKFEQMVRVANLMFSTPMLPLHLRGVIKKNEPTDWYSDEEVKATCFLVVNQAIRWNMDPFAVMGETYVVGGKLAWQGKLVAAVVNARANLKAPLNYRFEGTKGGDDYTCFVSGLFEGESEPRVSSLSYGSAKTSNSMWTKDPEQKLAYSAVVRWARRYCPEVVLGVMTDDDLERITEREVGPSVTKPVTKFEELKARLAQNAASEVKDAPESVSEQSTAPVDEPPFTDAEVVPAEEQSQEQPSEEVDELFTDFLLSIDEMTDGGEFNRAREQAMEFDSEEKIAAAKAKIKKRAESCGWVWSSKVKSFITG